MKLRKGLRLEADLHQTELPANWGSVPSKALGISTEHQFPMGSISTTGMLCGCTGRGGAKVAARGSGCLCWGSLVFHLPTSYVTGGRFPSLQMPTGTFLHEQLEWHFLECDLHIQWVLYVFLYNFSPEKMFSHYNCLAGLTVDDIGMFMSQIRQASWGTAHFHFTHCVLHPF